ncbi:hypothetical protein B0H11DRAFT_2215480 [Mycena galericulata]|nr:hypothetical protein B0H11DRAFT_2218804 [Mycena galericulata]KAJ7510736.1 hypothetical protein B0H11DRAFT_2215480 [Mycena galericulata]
MPEASTQTEATLIDTIEREFKQEAINYLEGRNTGPPSPEMLRWLGENLVPASVLPTKMAPSEDMTGWEKTQMDLTAREKAEMVELRKKRVADFLQKRAATDKRVLYALNPWLRP